MPTRRTLIKASAAAAMALQLAACSTLTSHRHHPLETGYDKKRRPAKSRPTPADRKTFNVLDHGAKGDSVTLDTKAIQAAIDRASSNRGGGKVVIPKGTFLTGSIFLKDNVNLHLATGATLLGSTDVYQYQRTPRGWLALIIAHDAANISITGNGTIDGQGRELALAIDALHHSGTRVTANYNYRRRRPHEAERPQLIECVKCVNIQLYDVDIRNAASWVQTYDLCEDLDIDNVKVTSLAYWNNDGFDISDCKNVRLTGCFVNAADDAICLKSHHRTASNDNIYIARCTVRSSASAIKFGTASTGGFKNITIENITVYDTYRSAIALESVDGGRLENITVSNVDATNTGNAIFLRLGHRNQDGEVGTLKNVTIKNVTADIPFGRPDIDYDLRGPALNQFFNPIPASIVGIPGHRVENVTLENIAITYPGRSSRGMAYIPLNRLSQVPENEKDYPEFSMFGELPAWGLYVRHAQGIALKNVTLRVPDREFRPALVFDNAADISMSDSTIYGDKETKQVALNHVHNAAFERNTVAGVRGNSILTLENCSQIRDS